MSQKQQILDKQLQNYYYDGHSVRQFQQVQHSQVQNSEQRQIYAQQINNPTQQIFQQQIQQTQQTPNIDQEIIPFDNSLSIIATSPPFQKVTGINNNNDMLSAQSLPQQPHQLVYVKSSSHTSSSPSTNNDISNNFNGLCFSKTLIKEEKAVVALTNESKNPEFVKLAIDASLVSHTSITAAAECSKSFYKFLRKWIHPIHSLSEWTKETPEISIKENKVTSNYFWLWNYKMKIHEQMNVGNRLQNEKLFI
ncbi:11310_t:CDS:2 [Entrophospora sp. SA101]|nr:11310_t:CDS:2 [Entrophospora sp. SA101]